MKIACVGWGSLIWRPKNLLIQNKWFEDGPILSVEFSRQSKDKRITLVLTENAKPIRTLWALMSVDNLSEAIESLEMREGIKNENSDKLIGRISVVDTATSKVHETIQRWLKVKDLDAAIWTNLGPKINGIEKVPTVSEVITYLNLLGYEDKLNAEEYIRKAPRQIDTEFRRQIEMRFGWSKID